MERKYIIPLRKEYQKSPIYKRTPRAVRTVKEFLQKHMKVEDVRLGKHLNMALWNNGNRNPPHKIEVNVKKFENKEGTYVRAEIPGKKFEEEEKKKDDKKKGKLQEKIEQMTGKKDTKVSGKMGKQEEHKEEEAKEKAKVLKEDTLKDKKEFDKDEKFAKREEQEAKEEETLIHRHDKKDTLKK
ncbi:MAG: 50S ribosomal protein L31e [archaeon]